MQSIATRIKSSDDSGYCNLSNCACTERPVHCDQNVLLCRRKNSLLSADYGTDHALIYARSDSERVLSNGTLDGGTLPRITSEGRGSLTQWERGEYKRGWREGLRERSKEFVSEGVPDPVEVRYLENEGDSV